MYYAWLSPTFPWFERAMFQMPFWLFHHNLTGIQRNDLPENKLEESKFRGDQ
jgi:hypothetical protein